jgi:hypothetical protein
MFTSSEYLFLCVILHLHVCNQEKQLHLLCVEGAISPTFVSDDNCSILNVAYNKSEYRYLYRSCFACTLYVINVSAFTLFTLFYSKSFLCLSSSVGTAAFIHKCYFIGSASESVIINDSFLKSMSMSLTHSLG